MSRKLRRAASDRGARAGTVAGCITSQPETMWAPLWRQVAEREGAAGVGYLNQGAPCGPDQLQALALFEQSARAQAWQNLRLLCTASAPQLIRAFQDQGYAPRTAPAPGYVVLEKSLAAAAELTERLVGWQPDQVGTLLYVLDRSLTPARVLLIRKKRGHGAGKINGPGGKLEPGETPLACALRETREEVGITVAHAELRAHIRFVESAGPQWLGHIYVARHFKGQPVETDEAVPAWFAVDKLPWDSMWEDDRLWLPAVLGGESLLADCLFTEGRLRAHRLVRVESLG